MRFDARCDGQDLSGDGWYFAIAGTAPEIPPASLAALRAAGMTLRPCRVPGDLDLDLHAAGLLPEPFVGMNVLEAQKYERHHVWYVREFDAAPKAGQDAFLVFEGVNCCADITLNGAEIGACDNMLIPHAFPVDGLLRARNELLVHIRPTAVEAEKYEYPDFLSAAFSGLERLRIRRAAHMYGWDIMPHAVSAGLWRPVRLEYRPKERLEQVYLQTVGLMENRSAARLCLYWDAKLSPSAGDSYELAMEARCGDSTFSLCRALPFRAGQFRFDVPNPRLWWPRGYGAPDLYDVAVTLRKNGATIDRWSFAFGCRTVALVRTSTTTPDGKGEFVFRVNGEKVFCKGSNWVPVDAYHSRDAERIPAILDMAVDLECNILRSWGGSVYENDLFFDLCDRKGIMVWQDFAMACGIYPQDEEFCRRLREEAVAVVRRLRQHACIVLWAGDNENDVYYIREHGGDPNANVLTRRVLPEVVRTEDFTRPYLPSSPCVEREAFKAGDESLPEHHLWGPRNYYKSDFYRNAACHFVSEIGYHGCVSPASAKKFLSPDKLWPCANNPEWVLHSTNASMGTMLWQNPPDHRVRLMIRQIRALFGDVPDTLEEFAFASQAVQAEAKKYFIERFRGGKWRRTGIIWWNLMDGWPQFSDAVVDYYFDRKLAYHFIKTVQAHFAVLFPEDADGTPRLTAVNDTLEPVPFDYSVRDLDSGATLAEGRSECPANAALHAADLPVARGRQACWVVEWKTKHGVGRNHYLAGEPPFDLRQYRSWLRRSGLYTGWWDR